MLNFLHNLREQVFYLLELNKTILPLSDGTLKRHTKALITISSVTVFLLFFFLVPVVSFQCLGFGGGGYEGTISLSCVAIGSGIVHNAVASNIYWSGNCSGGSEICPASLFILTSLLFG